MKCTAPRSSAARPCSAGVGRRASPAPDAAPIEAKLDVDEFGMSTWTHANLEDLVSDRIAELTAEGLSQREIALELGISKTTVQRRQKLAGIA